MRVKETLSASLEDYLEAIYHIVAEKQAARAKDISVRLKVNSSSVTGALRALTEKKLVNYAPYDVITLTPKGKKIAKDVVRRHQALSDFFVKVLSIDKKIAEEGACRMEHALRREILDQLVKFVEFVDTCSEKDAMWLRGFGQSHRKPGTKQK
ncbi:MAG: metal-dependent transcriptional regulator [Chloroflexi bacterium]|nr:metal-dependent transcriptional regulator [Chloroflexota bacterium]